MAYALLILFVRFLDAFNLACCDFAMNRLAMYSMVHTRSPFSFLPRVLHSNLGYLEHVISTGQLKINPDSNSILIK